MKLICLILPLISACAAGVTRAPASDEHATNLEATFKDLCLNYAFTEADGGPRPAPVTREFETVPFRGDRVNYNCHFANVHLIEVVNFRETSGLHKLCPFAKLSSRKGFPPNQELREALLQQGGPPGALTLACFGGAP